MNTSKPDPVFDAYHKMIDSPYNIAYDRPDSKGQRWIRLQHLQWPDGYCTFRAYPFEGTYRDAMIDGMKRIGFLPKDYQDD